MDCVPGQYTDPMAATKVVKKLEPQNKTGVFVRDLNRWPSLVHPLLCTTKIAAIIWLMHCGIDHYWAG